MNQMPEVPTVLVADDDVIVLEFVSFALRKAGFPVLSASGGLQALELVRNSQEPVSLAVLDVCMPGLSGPELFARLREIYPGMRALFISGYNPPQPEIPAGSDFLAKPFASPELLRRVREVAERPLTHRA